MMLSARCAIRFCKTAATSAVNTALVIFLTTIFFFFSDYPNFWCLSVATFLSVLEPKLEKILSKTWFVQIDAAAFNDSKSFVEILLKCEDRCSFHKLQK